MEHENPRWPGGPWWGGHPDGTPVLCGLVWVITGSLLLGARQGQAESRPGLTRPLAADPLPIFAAVFFMRIPSGVCDTVGTLDMRSGLA